MKVWFVNENIYHIDEEAGQFSGKLSFEATGTIINFFYASKLYQYTYFLLKSDVGQRTLSLIWHGVTKQNWFGNGELLHSRNEYNLGSVFMKCLMRHSTNHDQ